MPNRDKTGPNGDGPRTGRRGGNVPQKPRQGQERRVRRNPDSGQRRRSGRR